MKARKTLLPVLVAGALAFSGMALAQDDSSGTFPTAQGQVTINSVPAPAPQIAQAPPFKQLAAGGKWISEEQAVAYPPLANDFLNASHGGKHVSKTQYEAWVKQIK